MQVTLILSALFVVLVGWLVWHFLLSLPTPDPAAERAFLRGKVVWITGASSGIGKALAEHLRTAVEAGDGVKVVLSARTESSLAAVATSLSSGAASAGGGLRREDVLVLPLDLAKLAHDAQLADAAVAAVVERFGHVDVLVHNGGISMRGAVVDTALEVDRRLMDVNYFGAVALTKAVLPLMLARKSGSILAVSSVQGKLPIAFRSSYTASKHALHAWMMSLRHEVREHKDINVGVLSPGYVNTNLSLNALRADGATYGRMDASTARGYAPEFVARMVYAALQQRLPDVVLADVTARVGIMLYAIAPQLLDRIMVSRTRKERANMLRDEQNQQQAQ
jgi:dehydrogenase/reductase SDR family protein 7B